MLFTLMLKVTLCFKDSGNKENYMYIVYNPKWLMFDIMCEGVLVDWRIREQLAKNVMNHIAKTVVWC